MKISRRSFLKVAGAAGMAGALAACGGASSSTAASSAAASGSTSAANGDVTIRMTWWGGQTRHDLTQKVLDKYTELNPHVHFETTPSGWDGYFEKLATDTATGGMADIVQMDYMYISTYAKNGSLADLSSFASDGTLDISNVDDALADAGTIDGKMVHPPVHLSGVLHLQPRCAGRGRCGSSQERLDLGRLCFHLQDREGKDRQVRLRRLCFH